ncbi:MAG TPA: fumarylacetoacetate hydrolase family protein [Candidatus Didemnitutus sp.]|nr:fumarylacetoacetate hydrolase family protein [Candidatus Didemnitutus sp.]
MRLCRFANGGDRANIGAIIDDQTVVDLSPAGINRMELLLTADDPVARVKSLVHDRLPRHELSGLRLLAPVDHQEVWAAGVTYLRSKAARMEESDFSATAYDRVYSAARPEIFFKSIGEKVVATGDAVGIRSDAKWNVPEPELALVLNSRGAVVGYTVGNDMSSRDIEGENLLYLPQAKVYDRSCALGPWIVLGPSESEARQWMIRIRIERGGQEVFSGETSVSQIKRSFGELAGYLFRSQKFSNGVVLLTGTGVVPPESFTLAAEDVVTIDISGIGTLRNRVIVV